VVAASLDGAGVTAASWAARAPGSPALGRRLEKYRYYRPKPVGGAREDMAAPRSTRRRTRRSSRKTYGD